MADGVPDYSTSSEAVRDAKGVAFADLNEDVRLSVFAASGNARYSGADDRSTRLKRTPLFVQNNHICDTFFLKAISRPL